MPARPRPTRPGYGRLPPAARPPDGERRVHRVPAAPRPTASTTPTAATTRQVTTPTGSRRPYTRPAKTPSSSPERQQLLTHAQHLYPDGWFDRGGPIRTVRTGIEKRHRPGAAPGGGYDLAVQPPRKNDPVTAIPDVLPLEFGGAEAA
ncbi:DUF6349 family protein [Streptomyces sp. NPDC005355]|uniref:DUF6349 family protein n=1 Tax=Streptomyces sp. NPDC005355 TaxID=3157038 RepID=UPI0033B7846F